MSCLIGAFGGTYFRNIKIDGVWYKDAHKEFDSPATDWFQGVDVKTRVTSQKYSNAVNKYKVKCGQSLDEWLDKGWIKTEFDSHGWFVLDENQALLKLRDKSHRRGTRH